MYLKCELNRQMYIIYLSLKKLFGQLIVKCNLVKVLSAAGSAGYKDAFEFFAKTEMDLCVKWVNKRKQGDKYLLLCNVVTRIPEDIRWVLQNLAPNGKTT